MEGRSQVAKMAVSNDFLEYVLDQLAYAGEVIPRKMFGGVGLYLQDIFFALIADDILYFKVDDSNRQDYIASGTGPFRPFAEKSYTMQYYEVPIGVLEDREAVSLWAGKALEVARRKATCRKKT